MTTEANADTASGQPLGLGLGEGLGLAAEKKARNMLERMGVPAAQDYTDGDVVELAKLITYAEAVEKWKAGGERLFGSGGVSVSFALGGWWADRPWRKRA